MRTCMGVRSAVEIDEQTIGLVELSGAGGGRPLDSMNPSK